MGTYDTLPFYIQGPPAPPGNMVSCTLFSHLMHLMLSNALGELIKRHLSLSLSGFQTPYILPRRSHSQKLPPKNPYTLGLPPPQDPPAHTHPYSWGLSFPRPTSQPCPPKLTGFPLGPSSPVGPLGPGGPASPGCPDSPFSPRSPRGPWKMSGGYRWSQRGLEDQGCSPCFQDTFSLPSVPAVTAGCTCKVKPTGNPLDHLPFKERARAHSHPGVQPHRGWGAQAPGLWRGSSSRRSQHGMGEGGLRLRRVMGIGEQVLRVFTHLDTWLALDPWRSCLSWLPLQGN